MSYSASYEKAMAQHILTEFQYKLPIFEAYEEFCTNHGDDVISYKDFDFWWNRFENGLFDLDYDRSQDPKTREMSDIPVQIIEKIIDRMEWKEKCAFRQVCRTLQILVENSKLHLNSLSFASYLGQNYLRIDENHLENSSMEKLALILNHPKLSINKLSIGYSNYRNDVTMDTSVSVKTLLTSLNHQISVKSLTMEIKNQDDVMTVLPYLEPKTLEIIEIRHYDRQNYIPIDQIIDLEQWRQAKIVKLFTVTCPIDCLFHFTRITVYLRGVSIEDIVRLKDALLASPTFEKCRVILHREFNFNLLRSAIGTGQILENSSKKFVIAYGVDCVLFKKIDDNQ